MTIKFSIRLLYLLLMLLAACSTDSNNNEVDPVYKQEMHDFVQGISQYAKSILPGFVIIPQNGANLVTIDGNEDGSPETTYLSAIDGVGREDLFYGYSSDNQASPTSESDYLISFLDICEQNNVEVLTTDYCWDHSKMDDSYSKNSNKGYVSFAAPVRELNLIPDYPAHPFMENAENVQSLADVKNFLYLINPGQFTSKQGFIDSVNSTNYNLIIMDMFFDDVPFTIQEISQLKQKHNGGSRLIISYMSIGEAEDYRYYWDTSWKVGSPSWLSKENPKWEGNYKVKYWESEWQDIIFGNDNSYLKKIIDAGFDGVYLDIIDAFEYFE